MTAEVQSPPVPEVSMESTELKSFSNRLTELPVVMAAFEQLSQLYTSVKEKNSVTKMAFGAGETAVQTAAAATKPIINVATNTAFTLAKPVIGQVDEPAAAIDNVASETLAKVEEKFPFITKTPEEMVDTTKQTVVGKATEMYDKVQSTEMAKMLVAKTGDVLSFTELFAEMALPTDGNCKEDMEDLEIAERDGDKGNFVRATNLAKRVARRSKKRLMSLKPVTMTVETAQCAQQKMTDLVTRSTEKGKEVYDATMYIPSMALKITGEVAVSTKEFVFAFTNAHNVKDMPAAVLNITRKAAEPLSEVKDKAAAYLFVPSQVMTEYILSSRPVQWIIPHIVAAEDMSKLDITMEEIEDEIEDEVDDTPEQIDEKKEKADETN